MRRMSQRFLNGIRFCKSCGKRMLLQGYHDEHRLSRIMQQKCICFECAYWEDMKDYPPKYSEVLGDKILKIMPEVIDPDRTMLLGGKGKLRYFRKTDGTIIRSNDVWLIATVPEKHKKDFPATVMELTRLCYDRLTRDKRRCKSKACYDRYSCLRYDIKMEILKGAYNSVPTFWKIGDTHCKYFMDCRNPKLIKAT